MKLNQSIILKAGIAAISLGAFNVYAATSGSSEYVQNVDLSFPGMAAIIHVKNTSANKLVSEVKLQVQESEIDIEAHGFVQCGDDKDIDFKEAKIYFGPLSMFAEDINDNATLYQHSHPVSSKYRIGFGKWLTEASVENETFTVPLNQIKNGHPALRVDALEEINKKLQAHLQGGGNAADFYRHNQELVLHRPISIAGWCKTATSFSQTASKAGFETQNFTIQVKYQADPAVTDKPVLNAQLKGGNMPNQVTNVLPFKLDHATFQPNMPNHFGKCIPDENPKIRINFQVSGSEKGLIDLRVIPYSNTYADFGSYFQTTGMIKDPKNGGGYLDFNFPLIEILSQDKYSYMAISNNKTYNHNMQVQARFKNQEDGTWSEYKDFGGAVFKHRCIPQVTIPLGGNGGKLNFNNEGATDAMQVKPMQPNLVPKPLDKAAPLPTPTPKPMSIRTPTTTPIPTPLTIKQSEPEPTPVLKLKTN